jgi:phosphopantothenate synthetase
MSEERSDGRVLLAARAAVAPILLAATTVAAVAGAVLALLPALFRGRPAARAARRNVEMVIAPPERAASSDTASEPIAR